MEELIIFIAAHLGIDPSVLTPDSGPTKQDIPEWDSFSHITLIMAIEKKYSVRFRTESIALVDSIQSIHTFIINYVEP